MAYERAPITEAVIELRFAEEADPKVITRAAKGIADDYFFNEPNQQVSVTINEFGPQIRTVEGRRLSSLDRAEVVVFGSGSLVCSRLAPYSGWEAFRSRTVAAWEAWKSAGPSTILNRIGVRYINRIDVPNELAAPLLVEDFLNFYPKTPTGDREPMQNYAMQVVRSLGEDECGLVLNSSIVPSPLIGFTSFLLDLDVSRETNLPRKSDDVFALLDRMRVLKNDVFERCVTDRSRKLFA
jgi:uncharacterized protein (TIGR04255 family)